MKKIIFVGIHYKEQGMLPLCSSTLTGVRVDKIINTIDRTDYEFYKSNLFEATKIPGKGEWREHFDYWKTKCQLTEDDIVVLLGGKVKMIFNKFLNTLPVCQIVEVHHPAKVMSNPNLNKYIADVAHQVNEFLYIADNR